MREMNIAVVPGDGIGPEIVPVGLRVLEAASRLYDFGLRTRLFDFGAGRYHRHGAFMPDDALDTLRRFDAIYFGAVGVPEVDDRLPFRHFTAKVRKAFGQYVNQRPVRLLAGVDGPLRNVKPGEVDMVIVRENSEGEFVQLGGQHNPESPDGLATETSVFTRRGIERAAHYAYRLARRRRRRLTNVTKSNTLIHSLAYWDQVIEQVGRDYPDVTYERMYVDAAAANFVLRPQRFDVVLSSNMIGDILSDLGAAIMGSLGLGPSGNINPEREFPSMFEPIHGSAPDIAGRGIANPIGAIWSGALMLEHLGQPVAAAAIVRAIEKALADGLRTADLGGSATTRQVGDAVIRHLTAADSVAETPVRMA